MGCIHVRTFPERKHSKVSFCTFGVSASTDVFVPVKYAIVKSENQVIFFITLSITLAVIILSTKTRQRTCVAFLHAWIGALSLWKENTKKTHLKTVICFVIEQDVELIT